MDHPLVLLSAPLVAAMLENGFTLFVRQSYQDGRDHTDARTREIFLITPYKDIGEANQHFQQIRFDKRKYIYQSHHVEEVEKLYKAASQPTGYKVYVALTPAETFLPDETATATE
ncbi:hypothetical protein [Chitinophaga sp. MM2321]|uniref:hypothetical protein n=1 Tax=Chitinophaga sp. MM2321 TaxID=3137178 RepID=UPI0032D59D33